MIEKKKRTVHGSLLHMVWSEEFSESDVEEGALLTMGSSFSGGVFSRG